MSPRPASHPLRDAGEAARLMRSLVDRNLAGEPVGMYSACSANPFVLQACMIQGLRDSTAVCIESTANQVNQEGGYTGMTPAGFRNLVAETASAAGLPLDRVILGGDHLGPFPWRAKPRGPAMAKARELVRACVLAGYQKIHLDASMPLGDDRQVLGGALDEHLIVARAADLCRAAEQAHAELPPGSPAPVYVIGTEVPAPGGERVASSAATPTSAEAVARTVELTRTAFLAAGLSSAWERVLAIVAQPGVEFGAATVLDYDRSAAAALAGWPAAHGLAFEAHSTDFQSLPALRALVEDHFAVLKVGPWLTFALREAIFALAAIEDELPAAGPMRSQLRVTLERVMVEHPEHWRPYYDGTDDDMRLARAFGFSDRCRYYWPHPEVRHALQALIANLSARPIPPALLSQYMPAQYEAVRAGLLDSRPEALIVARILAVIDAYATACGMR